MALLTSIPIRESPVPDPDERFEQTLKVSGAVEVSARAVSGHINVTAADTSTVQIRATIRVHSAIAAAGGLDRRIQTVVSRPPIEQRGNIIKIGAIADHDLERNISISYDLTVPLLTRLVCRAASGSITVEGTAGVLDAATTSGAITATDIRGEVRAAAAAGEIEIQSVQGRATVSTGSGAILAVGVSSPLRAASASGSIAVEHALAPEIDIRTGSGNIALKDVRGRIRAVSCSGSIDVEGQGNEGPWRLETSSGAISVRLAAAKGFELRARTVAGDVRSSQLLSGLRWPGPREMHSRAGEGGLRLELATVTGNIRIE